MKNYIVASLGYNCCPSFPTLSQARAHLNAIVREEYTKCKRRHPKAGKHKLDEHTYRITLGSDSGSTIWSHHSIISQ